MYSKVVEEKTKMSDYNIYIYVYEIIEKNKYIIGQLIENCITIFFFFV